LVAVTRGREVGVDLEHIRPEMATDRIAARFFSDCELAALRALSPPVRPEAFFLCWTRKEAYLKATGAGLTLALDQFDVTLRPGEPAALLADRNDLAATRRWSLRELSPGPGFVGALAVEGPSWRLWCGDWEGWTADVDSHLRETAVEIGQAELAAVAGAGEDWS
jgi:4'-phosphopantetheinyl transferase